MKSELFGIIGAENLHVTQPTV